MVSSDAGDPVLFSLEQVERDRPCVVSLEQLVLLDSELGPPIREVGEFGGSFGQHLVEPGMDPRRDRLDRFRVDLHLGAEAFDESFNLLDQHRLSGAVASGSVPARAHEVGVDRALGALRVAHDQSRAALPAEHRALQVVLAYLGCVSGGSVCTEHGLYLVPHLVGDDRLVCSGVGDALEPDASLVVRVRQHPVHR